MKQLSKKERKYRNKIIAENHLKKDGQMYLDFYMENYVPKDKLRPVGLTYKYLHSHYGALSYMLMTYYLNKAINIVNKVIT